MDAADYQEVGRNPDGSIMLRVQILRWLAKLFRVQFKIGGWPYGASYERAINYQPQREGTLVRAAAATNARFGPIAAQLLGDHNGD